MIGAGKVGRVGARPGGGDMGELIKQFHVGGGSPMEVFLFSFFMWAVFSLHVEAIFSVCCGGVFLVCPPDIFFAGTPIIVITFFYFTDIYISSRSWRFEFFRELIFFFSLRLREGGRFFSPFRLFFGEHAGPGGGGGWLSDNDSNVRS